MTYKDRPRICYVVQTFLVWTEATFHLLAVTLSGLLCQDRQRRPGGLYPGFHGRRLTRLGRTDPRATRGLEDGGGVDLDDFLGKLLQVVLQGAVVDLEEGYEELLGPLPVLLEYPVVEQACTVPDLVLGPVVCPSLDERTTPCGRVSGNPGSHRADSRVTGGVQIVPGVFVVHPAGPPQRCTRSCQSWVCPGWGYGRTFQGLSLSGR